MDSRALVETALSAGDVAGALGFARAELQRAGVDARPDCYPLLPLERAADAPGVRVTSRWEDAEIASTARLVPGMMQFTDWAQGYRPRPLRRLRLEQCAALAPNVLVTAAGELLDDNVGFSNSELCRHRPEGSRGIAAANGRIVVAAPRGETVRIERPVVYLPASANYAAWLLGDLARLAVFEDLGELAMVLHGDASPFHFASLAAVGVARAQVIACGAASRVECRELHYCTPTYFHHAPSPRGLAHLRSRVAVPAGSGTPAPPRLYLGRRRIAGSRPILNEDDLVGLLGRYGCVPVDPEDLPFLEQVRLAAGAETIVGPYGANLANAVFARAARAALIVATKGQPEFSRLLGALAIPHWHVVADPVRIRDGGTFSESHGFRVDLDAAEAILRACLGAA